jgi:hypothetical protein
MVSYSMDFKMYPKLIVQSRKTELKKEIFKNTKTYDIYSDSAFHLYADLVERQPYPQPSSSDP